MIAIIDYGAGNLASVANALKRLDVVYQITSDPVRVASADKVIFPGQGRAGPAMKRLQETGLDKAIRSFTKPFLGICLGLQLLADFSEEDHTKCLGSIPGTIRLLPTTVKIPHMGWNKVSFTAPSPLTNGIADGSYFYFVHSYFGDVQPEYVIGKTDYGVSFTSVAAKGNFYAVQFHPEKSGDMGLRMLRNFCELC